MQLAALKESARAIVAAWMETPKTPATRYSLPLFGLFLHQWEEIPPRVWGVRVREGRVVEAGVLVFVDARALLRSISKMEAQEAQECQS